MLVMKRAGLFVLVLLALSATQALAQIETPGTDAAQMPLQPGVLYNHNAFVDAYLGARYFGGPEVPSLPQPEPNPELPASVSQSFYQQVSSDLTSGDSARVNASVQALKGLGGSGGAFGARPSSGAIMGSHQEATRSLKRTIRDLG